MTPELEHRESPKSSDKSVAIDFDNTIAQMGPGHSIGDPFPGAIEFLNKLNELGWRVTIYSSRPIFPGGKEEITAWLLQHDLPEYKIWTKPLAHHYIDDRAISFNGNWDEVSSKLLGTATENTADNILKGKFSYYEIADKFGINRETFVTDISRLYETEDLDTWHRTANSFGEKYGIFIDQDRFIRSANADMVLREAIGFAMDGFNSDRLYPGEHICLSQAERYGNIARVMTTTNSGYLIHDLNANEDIEIPENHSKFSKKIILGSVPPAALSGLPDFAISANQIYPDGLSYGDIRNWYEKHEDTLNNYISGRVVKGYYKLQHKLISPIGPFSRIINRFDSSMINSPLMGFAYCTRPESELYAIKFSAAPQNSFPEFTEDVMIGILSGLSTKNAQLMFDGDKGFVLILQTEPSEGNFDTLANECISSIISDINDPRVVCDAEPPAGGLNIQPGYQDNGAVLVPYTVNQDTGLGCVPVDVEDLSDFDPMLAKIV